MVAGSDAARFGLDFGRYGHCWPIGRSGGVDVQAKRGSKGFFFYSSRPWRDTGSAGQSFFRNPGILLVVDSMKRLTVIGATGSIGQNTLRVVEHLSDRFEIFALSANSAASLLAEQAAAFRPAVVAIGDAGRVDEFRHRCRELEIPIPEIVTGESGLRKITAAHEVDIVVSAAVGAAGVLPTYTAVASGKTVALANKEAMVIAGELLRKTAASTRARIIPVDSEHSAVDQCLRSGQRIEVRRLILTASGGPF